jgi:hypothetical protein
LDEGNLQAEVLQVEGRSNGIGQMAWCNGEKVKESRMFEEDSNSKSNNFV